MGNAKSVGAFNPNTFEPGLGATYRSLSLQDVCRSQKQIYDPSPAVSICPAGKSHTSLQRELLVSLVHQTDDQQRVKHKRVRTPARVCCSCNTFTSSTVPKKICSNNGQLFEGSFTCGKSPPLPDQSQAQRFCSTSVCLGRPSTSQPGLKPKTSRSIASATGHIFLSGAAELIVMERNSFANRTSSAQEL